MHTLEPYANWLKYYDPSFDERSPYFGKEYNYDLYQDAIYGYYIHPAWDPIGSETLYLKMLFTDYEQGYAAIELIGEWNDAIHNDIMLLKRNFLEVLMAESISRFILIGENLMNFHGSDDSYYEEWFEEVEDLNGWIAGVNFPEFIQDEQRRYHIDHYINMVGTLQVDHWRTLHPLRFCELINSLVTRRLGP